MRSPAQLWLANSRLSKKKLPSWSELHPDVGISYSLLGMKATRARA